MEHSNPNVYATLLSDGAKNALFLFNLYTGVQESDVKVYRHGTVKELGVVRLKASEVKYIEL